MVPIPSLKVEDATMEFHMEVKRPESSSSSHDPWKTFSMSMATQYLSHGGR
ncbi:MAG TPA: DUF2589 domain-containing protein [Candidatus Rikenella faecigallinarum]|uniref:DUF2589 domain-containing protein n=1 Tax=Candidatus Rikenella faecigallinarum TaxID=2838745 RepID=A0A9D1QE19_9BACT|nr:DUF2589 domain-containing protein [Candidatus Rikenella faecigallinarum]